MSALPSLLAGARTGVIIAMPISPMAILCANRTLNSGLWAGLSTGFGASTVHVAYSGVILWAFMKAGLSSMQTAVFLISRASA
jgi:threonine/homoserine/homoserine lactone efflux protein